MSGGLGHVAKIPRKGRNAARPTVKEMGSGMIGKDANGSMVVDGTGDNPGTIHWFGWSQKGVEVIVRMEGMTRMN
jgi:hypothetical protein